MASPVLSLASVFVPSCPMPAWASPSAPLVPGSFEPVLVGADRSRALALAQAEAFSRVFDLNLAETDVWGDLGSPSWVSRDGVSVLAASDGRILAAVRVSFVDLV